MMSGDHHYVWSSTKTMAILIISIGLLIMKSKTTGASYFRGLMRKIEEIGSRTRGHSIAML
ncbi:hypothetical protein DXC37_10060 [Bifidobacterium bifidum]|nr:hypothetical protein DXC37_10060 [Bifidobacterium bifidum]